jgi:hypothetical protein
VQTVHKMGAAHIPYAMGGLSPNTYVRPSDHVPSEHISRPVVNVLTARPIVAMARIVAVRHLWSEVRRAHELNVGERGGNGGRKSKRGALSHLWQFKVPRVHKLGELSNVGEHLGHITFGSATQGRNLFPVPATPAATQTRRISAFQDCAISSSFPLGSRHAGMIEGTEDRIKRNRTDAIHPDQGEEAEDLW